MHTFARIVSRCHLDTLFSATSSSSPRQEEQKGKRSFSRDQSGAIAIIFVLSLLPIIMMLGAAIDYARAALARSEAQDALDAATLAAVKQIGALDEKDISDLISAYVSANGPKDSNIKIDKIDIQDNPTSLQVWASGSTQMTLMQFANIDNIDFTVTSKTVAGNKTLEVVMVLDNSGSMASSAGSKTRIEALKDASKELIEILDEKKQDEESLSFGLVPFTQMVRLTAGLDGKDWKQVQWIDQNGVSSINGKNHPPNSNRLSLFATLKDPYTHQQIKWAGCVEARPHPLDIRDSTPNANEPDSYFVPFFHPDRREKYNSRRSTWSNDYYLPRDDWANGQTYAEKLAYGYYFNQTIRKSNYGPNYWCDMPRIMPLTHDTAAVESHISTMRANGATNIHMGTIWGLRLLSPQAPYTQGRAYDDEENIKALIIMTDGNNTYYNNYYHAYGWYSDGRISGSSSIVAEMNKRTTEACQAAKDAISDKARKIKIFTIYFGSPSVSTANMLKGCASKAEWYKSVSNASDLTKVFQNIASELSNLRLVE
ncbi:Flp pilus assembly protein TadG [Cohaesibacter marisflavi]|uniref:Flp pilus assembly protein TadG n=1 Tax=Cohaesibacter marisflavi TaxID=655353 RepID=A0A1I5HQR1_9HYPH|nr:TadE/TadG family type IV pilus assembly protein [Cohaesibacter marisflavi]SFO50151.1 Flp pilus assembly protein TadG [Cohaesibacter marisflavi]